MYVYAHVSVYLCASAHRGRKCLIPLEVESQTIVNQYTWVIGRKYSHLQEQ